MSLSLIVIIWTANLCKPFGEQKQIQSLWGTEMLVMFYLSWSPCQAPAASHSGRSPSVRASSAGRGPSPPSPGPGPATGRPCESLPPASPWPADGRTDGRTECFSLVSLGLRCRVNSPSATSLTPSSPSPVRRVCRGEGWGSRWCHSETRLRSW